MAATDVPDGSGSEPVLLRGASLLDGSGQEPLAEELRLEGGRIVERGAGLPSRGATVVDLDGRWLAPGFIDVHSHSDLTVLVRPELDSKVFQGVTTEVVGNCGASPFPVERSRLSELRAYVEGFYPGVPDRMNWNWNDLVGWAARVREARPAIHLAPLVGHGSSRIAVVGLENRALTSEEEGEVKDHVRDAMQAGAFGLSTGLAYSPELETRPTDLEPLLRVVVRHDGIYATHMRDESAGVEESLAETLALAQRAGVRLEVSHLKALGRARWGSAPRLLERVERARRAGLDVAADMYPYAAAETALAALLPGWATEGDPGTMALRLSDAPTRARIAEEVRRGIPRWTVGADSLHWEDVVISAVRTASSESCLGRSVAELSAQTGRAPVDVVFDLLLREAGGVSVLIHGLSPEDVRSTLANDSVLVGSDGVGNSPTHGPLPNTIHPRNYGTFPRFLAAAALEGPAALARAVRRITGAATDHFQIPERGYLLPGRAADLVVWRQDARDAGPELGERGRLCHLFESVWVGGTPVIWNAKGTEARPGTVLRHLPTPSGGSPSSGRRQESGPDRSTRRRRSPRSR